MLWKKKARIIGLVIFLLYLGISLVTIQDYGLTLDTPYEDLNGRILLNAWSGKGTKESLLINYQNNFYMPQKIGSAIAVLSHQFFHGTGLLPSDAAYHLPIIVLSSFALLIIYFWMLKEEGFRAAIFSSLAFIISPRVFGHVHNNLKDPFAMVSTLLFIWLFYRYFKSGKLCFAILSALSLVFMIHTKIYTFFAVVVIILWMIWNSKDSKRLLRKKYSWTHLLLALVLILILINLIAPHYWSRWLWTESLRVNDTLSQVTLYMGKIYFYEIPPKSYAPVMIILTTPLIVLLGLGAGLYRIFKNRKVKPFHSLLFLAFLIPVFKYIVFDFTIFHSVRQLMDSLPFMFMIAGIGLALVYGKVRQQLKKRFRKRKDKKIKEKADRWAEILSIAATIILFLPPLVMMIQLHPYQTTYYNPIIGGTSGAVGNFDLDYWGSSYKQGTLWINDNLPEGSIVTSPIADYLVEYYLDEEFIFVKKDDIESLENIEEFYIITLKNAYYAADHKKWLNQQVAHGEMVYQVKAKGTALADIWRITS